MVITGASTGIGAATARLAVQNGWNVVLAARSLEKLEALVQELGHDKVLAIRCDVTIWTEQQSMIQTALEHFGQLDAVFANAGVAKGGSFLKGDPTPEAWQEMILTNVLGMAFSARAALKALLETKGHLLFTSSVAGRVNAAGSLYSATKWAVTAMAENIRKEIHGTGVRVTCLEPGAVRTPFWAERDTAGFDSFLQDTDVANAVIYALSQPPQVSINELLIRPTGQLT